MKSFQWTHEWQPDELQEGCGRAAWQIMKRNLICFSLGSAVCVLGAYTLAGDGWTFGACICLGAALLIAMVPWLQWRKLRQILIQQIQWLHRGEVEFDVSAEGFGSRSSVYSGQFKWPVISRVIQGDRVWILFAGRGVLLMPIDQVPQDVRQQIADSVRPQPFSGR